MTPRPYTVTRSTSDHGDRIVWTARTPDHQVYGTLIMTASDNVIDWVGVHPKFRRHGIATALLQAARADGFSPIHSQHRTPDGNAWARSTGEPSTRRGLTHSRQSC